MPTTTLQKDREPKNIIVRAEPASTNGDKDGKQQAVRGEGSKIEKRDVTQDLRETW